MQTRLGRLALLAILILPSQSVPGRAEKLEQEFADRFSSLAIENPGGQTEIKSWDKATLRVVASRPGDGAVLDSEISIERRTGRIRIALRPRDGNPPIDLSVYLPASVNVTIRSAAGDVAAAGIFGGLSIVTESGSVTIRLPDTVSADFSLRSLEGAVREGVSLSVFGARDAHLLDGRTGAGGVPIIVRSTRGNISVVRDDSADYASTTTPTTRERDVKDHEGGGADTAANRAAPGQTNLAGGPSRRGEETIRLEGRLVNLNVKVSDAGGKTLPALRKEDFLIYEDGVQQDVSFFEPVTAPLHVVLLLDLSGSTDKKMKVIKKAAQRFVDSLKTSDTIAVAGFTRRFFIISNFTTDHKLLKDRIDDIKNRHSGTAYYDAMWSTLDLFLETNTTRKAVVVLTDGVDNSLDHPDDGEYDPKHGFDELLDRVQEADVTIYPIYLDTEYETIGRSGRGGHEAYVTARRQLEAMADQTGAMMFKAERPEDLDGVYQQVAAELHSLYSIAYAPRVVRNDGKWMKINVTVNLPGAKARAKRGYYAK